MKRVGRKKLSSAGWIAFLAALLALALSTGGYLFAGAAALLALASPAPDQGFRLSRRGRWVAAGAVAALVAIGHGTLGGGFTPDLFMIGEMLAAVFVCSLYEPDTAWDRGMRLALSGGTLICAGNTDANSWYFPLVVIFVAAAVPLNLQLAGVTFRGERAVRAGGWVWTLVAMALACAVGLGLIATVGLAAVKNVSGGFLRDLSRPGLDFSGLSNVTRLGYVDSFQDSRKIIMRIFTPREPGLVRARVYVHYSKGVWQGHVFPVYEISEDARVPRAQAVAWGLPDRVAVLYRLASENAVSRGLADLPVAQHILVAGGPSFVTVAPVPAGALLVQTDHAPVYADCYGILYHVRSGWGAEYDVLGMRTHSPDLAMPDLVAPYCRVTGKVTGTSDADMLKECRETPETRSPAMGRLARDVTRGCASDEARAQTLCAYFRRHYRYSLRPRPRWIPDDGDNDEDVFRAGHDPVEDFVLGRQPAHCEFFASGMTLLLRAVGVPARYVVGFAVHEHHTAAGGYYVVRESDAHAWCEVYLKGRGWVSFDPTPPGHTAPVAGHESRTEAFVEAMGLHLTRLSVRVVQWLRRILDRVRSASAWVRGGTAGGVLAVGIFLLAALRTARRRGRGWLASLGPLRFRRRIRPSLPAHVLHLEALVRDFDAVFESRGVTRGAHTTLKEGAARVAATLASAEVDTLTRAVQDYYRLRYREPVPAEADCQAIQDALRDLGAGRK